MLSFHATKVYHTMEGGALVFNRPSMKERADALRNISGFPETKKILLSPEPTESSMKSGRRRSSAS
jgi:dTDP-4-amino-4,6-dideoxygalactose transaminase